MHKNQNDIRTNTEGVAMAMVAQNFAGMGGTVAFTGGLGVGLNKGSMGVGVGVQVGW